MVAGSAEVERVSSDVGATATDDVERGDVDGVADVVTGSVVLRLLHDAKTVTAVRRMAVRRRMAVTLRIRAVAS